MVAPQLLDVADVVGVQQRCGRCEPRGIRLPSRGARSSASALREVLLGLDVVLQQLQVQRAQEARRLAQDRDDPRVRAAPRRSRAAAVRERRYGGEASPASCSGRGVGEQREVLLERVAAVAAGAGGKRERRSLREEPRLLELGHEDLRVAPQHLVERGRAALGVADDEEVGHPPGACAFHSVPSLSNVAMRCGTGTKSGEPSRATAVTKLMIDCLAAPSFQEGRGSPVVVCAAAGKSVFGNTVSTARAEISRRRLTLATNEVCVMDFAFQRQDRRRVRNSQ